MRSPHRLLKTEIHEHDDGVVDETQSTWTAGRVEFQSTAVYDGIHPTSTTSPDAYKGRRMPQLCRILASKTTQQLPTQRKSFSPAATCRSAGDLCPTVGLSEARCTWISVPDARPVVIDRGNFVALSPTKNKKRGDDIQFPHGGIHAQRVGERKSCYMISDTLARSP